MFKKLKDSPYWKVMLVFLLAGGILIVFSNWISKTHFTVGFETVNSALVPIYIGIVFAFLICPVYNFFVKKTYAALFNSSREKKPIDDKERRRFLTTSRIVATIACLLIVIGFVSLLVYFIVPQVVNSCINLVDTLPERLAALSDWLRSHFGRFPQLANWVDNVASLGANGIAKWIQTNVIGGSAISIATMISSGVMAAVGTVIDAFVGVFFMVYLLNYKETLFAMCRKFIAATCSQKSQDRLYEFSDIFNETFVGFIVGRIIDSCIIGVLTYVVLVIFGIPFAPMISVIVGVTNVIPFFGPFFGAIPSVLILMLEDPIKALWFAIIILVIQQIDGNIIGPKVVGNAIGIGSFWVLLAVLIGGGLFGFGGMVFGVPVFAVIYRYVNKMTTRKLYKSGKATHTADYFTLEQFGIDASEVHLEVYDRRQNSLLNKLKKTKDIPEELMSDIDEDLTLADQIVDEVRDAVKNDPSDEELEEIKNRLAQELLGHEKLDQLYKNQIKKEDQ